jgi:hypothetical protein
MFSQSIVESDAFLDMPLSSQGLYLHLSMNADDYGFVSPKRIMRMIGANEDDLKILLAKRYILGFESGVVVIKHWHLNNTIRKDRSIQTTYEKEHASLTFNEFGAYTEITKITTTVEQLTDMVANPTTSGKPNDNQMSPQIRLEEIRLDKTRLEKSDDKSSQAAGKPATPKVKSSDIDLLFEKWESIVGYGVTSNLKANREAASKLIRENSMDAIEKMIGGVALSHADQYAPRISNFIQLYRKWDDLKAWGRRSQQTINANKPRSHKL